MRYFKSFEGEEKFPALASRVNYLKNTREGHMGLSGFVKKVAKESREEGRAEGRAKGRAEGEAKGRLEGILTAYVNSVKNFMKSTGNSIEVAFKLLCIPAEMQPQVQKMI